MPHPWMKLVKLLLIPLILLVAMHDFAGGAEPDVGDMFVLESVNSQDGQSSRVYRAENMTVPEVAKMLAAEREPDEISREDAQNMFLVYGDTWYHLQQDSGNPSDTLIQVNSKEYVEENYDSSFLKAYFLASILNELLDDWDGGGSYRGYPSYPGYPGKNVDQSKDVSGTPDGTKIAPPKTKEGTGSIFRRSDKSADNTAATVDSGASVFTKSSSASASSSTGRIVRNSSDSGGTWSKVTTKSSRFQPAKTSPPRTKAGGVGRIFKRR